MANILVERNSLSDIADSIRAKNGTQTTYKPSEMSAAIDALPSSGITPTGEIEITANGTYDVTNYASADVNVPTGSTPVINSLSITENGTYTAPTGVDGYSPITVNVPSGGGGGGTEVTISNNCTNASACLQELFPSRVATNHLYVAYLKNKAVSNFETDQLISLQAFGNGSFGNGVRWRNSAFSTFTGLSTNYDAKAVVGDVYVTYDIQYEE